MSETIVIILIVALVIIAVIINGVQQQKEKAEAEKRAELTKQRMIIDEAEELLLSASQLPITKELNLIIHQRLLSALEISKNLNPKMLDIEQRINDIRERMVTISSKADGNVMEQIVIPENDKQIVMVLQGIKKLRAVLRAENARGKVDTHQLMTEDKKLSKGQLMVNVETMIKRGSHAIENSMLGSARQYFEKASRFLSEQLEADEYVTSRRELVEENLYMIKDNLRNTNSKRPTEDNSKELDELFAPKKKW